MRLSILRIAMVMITSQSIVAQIVPPEGLAEDVDRDGVQMVSPGPNETDRVSTLSYRPRHFRAALTLGSPSSSPLRLPGLAKGPNTRFYRGRTVSFSKRSVFYRLPAAQCARTFSATPWTKKAKCSSF